MRPAPRLLLGRWRAASLFCGSRGLLTALIILFSVLVLSACDKGPEISPYDYDKREKAKIKLPRDTSMDVDTDEFILKRKFRLP